MGIYLCTLRSNHSTCPFTSGQIDALVSLLVRLLLLLVRWFEFGKGFGHRWLLSFPNTHFLSPFLFGTQYHQWWYRLPFLPGSNRLCVLGYGQPVTVSRSETIWWYLSAEIWILLQFVQIHAEQELHIVIKSVEDFCHVVFKPIRWICIVRKLEFWRGWRRLYQLIFERLSVK